MTTVEAYVARVVAGAPPLRADQRARLAGLLRCRSTAALPTHERAAEPLAGAVRA